MQQNRELRKKEFEIRNKEDFEKEEDKEQTKLNKFIIKNENQTKNL